jgi:hypothetical protein
MDSPTIGAIVGIAFGCAWGLGGATGLPHPWREWAMGISIAISLALFAALVLPHAPRHSGTFRGLTYGIAVTFEVVAIFATAWFLNRLSLQAFLLPAVGFIVGLHFIGLWKATDLTVFLYTAVALCVVCVLAAALPTLTERGINLKTVVSGLGCAVVLWVAGATTLLRHSSSR